MAEERITETQWEQIPDAWGNEGTAPSETLRQTGFKAGDKPPAAVFNRLFYKFRAVCTEIHDVVTALQRETASCFSANRTAISDLTNSLELHAHDDRYYTESEVDTKLSGKAPSSHTHDERYYTESEVDDKLSEKAASSHSHANATSSAAGFMSAEEKSKLAGIAAGANKTTVDSALSSTSTNPVQNKVINSALSGKAASSHTHDERYYTESEVDNKLSGKAASSHSHNAATTSASGFMSSSDKQKMGRIQAGSIVVQTTGTKVDLGTSMGSTNYAVVLTPQGQSSLSEDHFEAEAFVYNKTATSFYVKGPKGGEGYFYVAIPF